MLEIKDLTFSYGRKKKKLFDGFSLALQPGTVYGLLGKNGSGKSTLLYLMSGLLRPSRGTVRLDGADAARRFPSVLRKLFIVPEEFSLPPVTLARYVRLNAPFYPRFSEEILRRCLTDFEMDADMRLDELSMGQKKKVFMSFALAANTELLLMDEPTNGFDIPSKSQMRKVIAANMADDKAILISTHQVADVDRLLDHVAMIDGGELLLNAPIPTIGRRLRFEERPLSEPTDDAIFCQSSLQGNSVVCRNQTGEDSVVNLETLFSAMLAFRREMSEAIGEEPTNADGDE